MTRQPLRLASVAALVVATLLLGACAQSSRAQGPPPPDSPITSNPSTDSPIPSPSPQRVSPRSGLVDPHPVSWESVKVIDPRTLEFVFYGGVEECYGLDRVDVTYGDEAITVTLYEGRVPGAGVCIEIAVLKSVRVALDEPLNGRDILDGADN